MQSDCLRECLLALPAAFEGGLAKNLGVPPADVSCELKLPEARTRRSMAEAPVELRCVSPGGARGEDSVTRLRVMILSTAPKAPK